MSATDSADTTLLHLEVLTPEAVLFEGDVAWLMVPLHDGLLGIWPGHAPLVGAMAAGEVRYEQDGQERAFMVASGVLRVGVERCAILISQTSAQDGASEGDGLGTKIVEMLGETLPDEVAATLEREDDQLGPARVEV